MLLTTSFFLQKKNKIDNLTPLKLIKLCYISYAWYLSLKNKQLFSERPQAWQYGPVFPTLYAEFKDFGRNPITKYIIYPPMDDKWEETRKEAPMLVGTSEDEKYESGLVETIFDFYKHKTGADLSEITHAKGSAWESVWNNGEGKHKELDPNLIKKGAEKGIARFLDELNR